MQYELKTEDFEIDCEIKFNKEDASYPVNSILHIAVTSGRFCGESTMDMDIHDFTVFVSDLKNLYESLKGTARIEEPYGVHQFIEFGCDNKGHIKVKGYLNSDGADGFNQKLQFENELDQTCLKNFAYKLYNDNKKYLK